MNAPAEDTSGTDHFALVAAERRRLADELDLLTAEEWALPSLCDAWSNHEVAAHLNVPFTVGTAQFLVGLAKAFGNFDKANVRFAKELAARMDPSACVDGLRANAEHHFTPPGYGPEAPLSDTIIHGIDILHGLGRSVAVAPEAYEVVLSFLASSKGSKAFGAAKLGDLRFEPNDVDLVVGRGDAPVVGPARAILAVASGRAACLDEVSGAGADLLRQRLS